MEVVAMSNRHTGIARGFRDVDAHAQAQDFSTYLERLARVMAAEKASSYDLLHRSSCGRSPSRSTSSDSRTPARPTGSPISAIATAAVPSSPR
jgi:hypothetical protein